MEPVSVAAQAAIGFSALAGMAVVKLLRPRSLIGRHIFLALATVIVARYVFWRTTATLPPIEDLGDFIPGIMLWGAEMLSVLMFAFSLFVVADPVERKPAPLLADDLLPTVDVFVPSYNEDPGLLGLTLAAATALDYPKDRLRVFLLDDGGTDQKCHAADPAAAAAARARRETLQALAADVGAHYLTRPRNEHAKAGNLNWALRHSTGDLVAVFDADHVPMRDFLRRTVGYFVEDARLFLVQTPHVFGNPDPIEKNLRTFERMPSENEMFYGVIQKGLDKWNAAFFCGSAALLRRKALEEVGGFAGLSITEDCETALALHGRGWNSLYVDQPLISGLQPESLAAFIGQRSRWARGMFQIFLLKNPALQPGLSLAQRLCYLANIMYWFLSLSRLSFFAAPLLYIFFSWHVFQANAQQTFAYTVIYMAANMLTQSYLYNRVRWPFVSELYEYVQSVYLAPALLSVVLNPRKPSFNVTDKGKSLDRHHLSALAAPYFAIFAVLLGAGLYGAYRLATEPQSHDALLVVVLWNLVNLLIAGVALGVAAERPTPRARIEAPVELALGTAITAGRMVSASYAECRIAVPNEALRGTPRRDSVGVLGLPGAAGAAETVSVRVTAVTQEAGETLIDCVFPALRARHYRALVALLYPDSAALTAWREARRRPKGLVTGIVSFLGWAATEPLRGLRQGLADMIAAAAPVPAAEAAPTEMPAAAFAEAAAAFSAEMAAETRLRSSPAAAGRTTSLAA